MSDPTNPTAPVAQEPAQGIPAPAAPSAPAPAAAAPQTAPETPAKPPYVNPWQGRTPAPAASAAKAPAPLAAPPAASVADPRVDALMAVLGETVAQDLGALPPNVAATVKAIAGDDPVAQRKAINAMRANGLASVATAAPLPPPASTVMPAAPAAPIAQSPAADDGARLVEYEKLAKVAPTLANAYRLSHADSISRALAARTPAN